MRNSLKFGLVGVGAVMATQGVALHIVGWSAERGGFSSISTAPGYAATRNAIQVNYPGSTIGSVSALTAASIAGADVLWLGSTTGETAAITPLSAEEQSVLMGFVQGGGKVILFGDNSTFAATAPEANASLMSPFGVEITGTISGTAFHFFANTSVYPAVGLGGNCEPVYSGWPGWFSSFPESFVRILHLNSNTNFPSCITNPPGAISEGSGRVWLVSDTGVNTGGGAQNLAWNVLFVNMLQEHSRISGQISLGDWIGDTAAQTATITVWEGTTPVHTVPNVPLTASGGYQVTIPLYGNYSVSADVSHWIRRKNPVLVQDGATLDFVLPNGDSDGSGEVDAADIDAVIADFGGTDENADLDGSGETDAADIDIAIGNFGSTDD